MIKLNQLDKEYVVGTKVVNNLNLEIRDGEIFGFLGPNGAGKTTTLKMITGVSSITNGNIEINGFINNCVCKKWHVFYQPSTKYFGI